MAKNYLVNIVLTSFIIYAVRSEILMSSLTFVIDDTGSMTDDIDQVKLGANAIFDTVLNSNRSQIDNFLLVTFNDDGFGDRGVEVRADTKDRKVFRDALSAINVHGGADCPEYAMAGIKTALEKSLAHSQLYIFTDATAKDYDIFEEVKNLALKKQCQIIFVLTGNCYMPSTSPDFKVYRDVADATDGEVFELTKPEVGKVLEYVKKSVVARKATLTKRTLSSGEHNMTFTADVIMGEVTLSLASVDPDKPDVEIFAPDGSDVWKKMLFETDQIKVYSIDVTMPGVHTVKVNSKSETRAKVAAISGLDFEHGFSKLKLASIVDTSSRPAPGVKSHLSIKLNEGDIELKNVHILDMDDNVLMKLPLDEVNKKTKFYSTKPFDPPRTMFKIMIEGYDPKSKSFVFRKPDTPIEPQPLIRGENRKPSVVIEDGTEINADYDEPLQLVCEVNGYPQPDIFWKNKDKGTVYSGETTEKELPYDYINILNIPKVNENATFECEATNSLGSDAKIITVKTLNPRRFNVVKTPRTIKLEFGEEGKIECKVDAYPPADVTWYKNGKKLISSDNLDMSSDKSILTIKRVQLSDKGGYLCEARNAYRRELVFKRVFVVGLESPTIDKSQPSHIKVSKDSTAVLECRILSGNPRPTISWYRILGENSQEQIEIEDWKNKERVEVNKANKLDSGMYLCQAMNEASRDYLEINLEVAYPPSIEIIKAIQVAAGTEVYIPCRADGGPVPEVTWTKDDTKLENNDRIHIFRDNTLKFVARSSDSGNYTCTAKNSYGSVSRTVKVDINVPVTITPPADDKVPVIKGSWISLPCDATGDPEPEIVWMHFSFNTSTLSTKIIKPAANGELQLNDVQENQGGFYTCVATNPGGSMNITYEVLVYAPPVIEKHVEKSFEAVEGDRVLRMPCQASGNPKPTISWTKDEMKLASGSTYFIEDGTLIIRNIPNDAKGYYKCYAENSVGTDEEEFRVIVQKHPTVSDLPTLAVMIEQGKTAEIKCPVPHKSVDQLRWYKDGKLIRKNELTLANVTLKDSGIYTCRVSNFVKSGSGNIKITVGDKPKFTYEEDEDVEMVEGLSLSCENEGYPKTEVTWYHDGKKIDWTEPDFYFTMGANNPGQYMCEVKNSLGRITRIFNVTPRDCFINMRQLSKYQPLMLSSGLTWPLFEKSDDYIVFTKGEQFNLFCPKKFKTFPGQHITAFCDGGMNLLVNGRKFDYADIECIDEVNHIVQRTGEKCMESENSERIIIAYNASLEFGIQKMVYEICWNKIDNVPIYAKHNMLNSLADNDIESRIWSDKEQFSMNFENAYDCDKQIPTISSWLGRWFHDSDRCCFSKRQLVNPRDVFPGLPQKATYSYFNVVPHWSSCNTENWDEMEKRVRNFAKNSFVNLLVYTGAVQKLSMQLPRGTTSNFFTDNMGYGQPVPKFLWKVIQDPASRNSLAIVQINVPDLQPSELSKYILCNDVCDRIEWMRSPDWRDVNRGYTYCCSLEEFENKFRMKGVFEPDMTPLLASEASILPGSYSFIH